MVEYVKILKSFGKYSGSIIKLSDEQIDETGKTISQPVLVFSVEGERLGYISISELQKWIDSKMPSEIMKALSKETNKEEEFVIEDYGKEYIVGRDGMETVRYAAWRLDRPNVRGYGKTPNDAIYDLTQNVQPL